MKLYRSEQTMHRTKMKTKIWQQG